MAVASTQADLIYAHVDGQEKPYQWINPPPKGVAQTNHIPQSYDSTIYNIRPEASKYNLDKNGFQPLLDEPTEMTYDDWSNEETVRTKYYREVEALLKRQLGAHTVTIFDHTIRRRPPKNTVVPDTPESRQPVSRCHVDQTESSAIRRVKRHNPDEADELLKGRTRLINVWRPFRTVKDMPLAVADFQTVDHQKDLSPSDLIYSEDLIGETLLVNYNPNHRWYYVDEMQPNEALLLKCYDSSSPVTSPKDGIASLTPHTAFIDKRFIDVDGIPPRESIEIRALVYSN